MNTKKLKQLVLDLAIHGKLVPQDPNDEPASELLKRIVETHGRASNIGRASNKKSAISSDNLDDVPFEVPEGWVWCKLSSIASFSGGKTPSTTIKEFWENGSNLWVTSKDMKSVYIYDSLMKISDKALDDMNLYSPDTLLMVTRSGILRHTLPLAILKKPATINQDIKAISFYDKDFVFYIYIVLKANENLILEDYHKDGTTVDSINFDKFIDFPIPLPPLSEQRRIVSEIEKWFGIIDQLESNEADLRKSIEQTKKKVLDLAIHGKLVEQDPNDEPASELLKRIVETHGRASNIDRASKISKGKKSAISSEEIDEVPFEVPEGWVWTKFGLISNVVRGGSPRPAGSELYYNGSIPFMKVADITKDDGMFVYSAQSSIKEAGLKKTRLIDVNTLVISNSGATLGVPKITKFKTTINDGVAAFEGFADEIKFFAYWYLKTLTKSLRNIDQGAAQPNLNTDLIKDLFIPLPPLSEQRRIVAKIEEVFGELDRIEEMIG